MPVSSPDAEVVDKYVGLQGKELTPRQLQANSTILRGNATHQLLYGGSRSGKSYLFMRAVIVRALRAKHSTHTVLRYRFNHLRESIIEQTLPAVMRGSFPDVTYRLKQDDWSVTFNGEPDSGKVLFGGLDEKERTEKILGQEHSTIWLNEVSQISYPSRNKVITRLAQKSGLKLRAYYDCNPPPKGHWTHRIFVELKEPNTRRPLADPHDYAMMQMNPGDNEAHIAPEYMRLLRSLPDRDQARFLRGEFTDVVEGALWTLETIDACHRVMVDIEQLVEIVVAVDPSGASSSEDKSSDEIGLVVAGKDAAGVAYVLEDASGRMGPLEWAKKANELYVKWKASRIIAEQNFGGAMVEAVLRSASSSAPIKMITASRGKHVRAEPVAALYEKGRVVHCDDFPELEEQLCGFSTSGYSGDHSPDRADALVWAITELLVPPDNSLAILDYMRMQNDAIVDAVKEGPVYVRMKAPPGIGTVFGRYGAMYNTDSEGCINAEADDVDAFKRNGFKPIMETTQ